MAIRTRGDGLQIDVQVTRAGTAVRHREKWTGSMEDAKVREAVIKAALLAGEDPGHGRGTAKAAQSVLTLSSSLQQVYDRYWADGAMARTVKSHIKAALAFFGPDRDIRSITTDDADEYIDSLKREGLAASTIRGRCVCLTKMFNHYHRRGNIDSKPHFEMPRVGDNTRDRVLSEAEERELFDLFLHSYNDAMRVRPSSPQGEDLMDFFLFLLHTGARPSEARSVHTRNLRGDLLTFVRTKNGERRTLPLTAFALAALRRLEERYGPAPFEWATEATVRHAWDWARGQMGFSDDKGFIPYLLRHTCATRLYDRTRDLLLVQKWMGHKTIQITLRYAKLMPGDLERARDLMQGVATPVVRV